VPKPYTRRRRTVVVRARKKAAAPAKETAPEDKRLAKQGKGTGVTGIGVQKVFQLRLDFMVSQGSKYEGESHGQVMAKIEALIKAEYPDALFTPTGGYYLIDGDGTYGQREVCRPQDFDHETMSRRPGTFPPSWSLSAEMQASVERQLRVLRELQNPPMSRQPGNLYTTQELDRLKGISDENNRKHAEAHPPKRTAKKVAVAPKESAALKEAKAVADTAAGKKLAGIAKERPDLIKDAPKATVKRIVKKKTT
jgi:hypothetical protein